jgi:hypothetical protein
MKVGIPGFKGPRAKAALQWILGINLSGFFQPERLVSSLTLARVFFQRVPFPITLTCNNFRFLKSQTKLSPVSRIESASVY